MASKTVYPRPCPLSASGSTSSFIESQNTSPSPISLSPSPCSAPTRIHPMVTRAQNHIVQPRVFTDGRIKYPIPRALLVVSNTDIAEPTCYTNVVRIPEWRQAM